MPGIRKTEAQRIDAFEVFKQGFQPARIHRLLKERFDRGDYGWDVDLVHLNTIKNWVKEFKENDRGLDNSFEWHRLQDIGLPWEASNVLLPMWAWVKESGPFATAGFDFPSPSVREIKWWWRIYLVDSNLPYDWIWTIAQWFMVRELLHDVFGQPLVMHDLEAYLAYRPWHESNLNTYQEAVEEGRIPQIQTTDIWPDWGPSTLDLSTRELPNGMVFLRTIAFLIARDVGTLFPQANFIEPTSL